jgi:SAM-dependent methyltransferase
MINNILRKNIKNFEKGIDFLYSSKYSTHGLRKSLRSLRKELVLFKNHVNAKRIQVRSKNLNVQIGGGVHCLKDFINIDIFPPADIIFDLREKIPLTSGSVKFLFSEHFLEHIDYPVSVKKFISESYRVLKKGGKIVVGVPDAERIINAYAKHDKKKIHEYITTWYKNRDNLEHFNTSIDVLNYHLRDQDDSDSYTPHLWGYDHEKMTSLFKSVGYKKIKKWKFDSKIANPKRKFGSVYIEAVK